MKAIIITILTEIFNSFKMKFNLRQTDDFKHMIRD